MKERHKLLMGQSEFHPCIYLFVNPLKIGDIIITTFRNWHNVVKGSIYTRNEGASSIGALIILLFKEQFNGLPHMF